MIIDILVVLMVLGAGFVGFQKGFIQPLLAEVLFVGTLLVLLDNRNSYLTFMKGVFHANAPIAILAALILATVFSYIGVRLGGIVHRMPSVRGWDGFLGIAVQALVAIVFAYAVISTMIVLDKAVSPAATNSALNPAQARGLQKQLESNPLTAPLGDSQDFQTLLSRAAKPGGARITDASQVNQFVTLYQDLFRSQLERSRLAPWVMRIGDHVPGVGHFGPQDLPKG
jgi:uncharacterized membrane protein required for colicin V production